jgi:hypothetical protein
MSAIERGDPDPPEKLRPLGHDALHKRAAVRMLAESPDQTLHEPAAALVRRCSVAGLSGKEAAATTGSHHSQSIRRAAR